MDFDHLERLAAEPRTELTRLGEICAVHNMLVISDEIHGDITFTGHNHTPFASLGPAFGTQGIGFARLNIACPRAVLDQALTRLQQAVHAGGFAK